MQVSASSIEKSVIEFGPESFQLCSWCYDVTLFYLYTALHHAVLLCAKLQHNVSVSYNIMLSVSYNIMLSCFVLIYSMMSCLLLYKVAL